MNMFSYSMPVNAEMKSNEIYTTSLEGIKENNDTEWEYVLISGTEEIEMTYGSFASGGTTYYGMIVPKESYVHSSDSYARFMANGGSHPAQSGDIAAVYNVHENGKLDLTLKVGVSNAASDGVKVSIYKNNANNILCNATVVKKADGTKVLTAKGVSVSLGDRLYFTLNRNSSLSSDGGTFQAIVETAKIDTKSIEGIKENNNTNWSYVLVNKSTGTETEMTYKEYGGNPAMQIETTTNDKYARLVNNGGAHPAYSGDIAAVYTADTAGYLDCSLQVRFNQTADGVNVKIWINSKTEYLLIPTQVSNATGTEVLNYEVPGVSVQEGDKIYFALDYNTALSSDGGHFVARVTTGKKIATNKQYSGNVMAEKADYGYSYVHITDDGRETAMTYATSSNAYMNGLSGKAYTTTSNATAFFNDKYQVGSASAGTSAQVYNVQEDGKMTVRLSARANNPTAFAKGDGVGIAIALNDSVTGGLDGWTYLTAAEGGSGTEKSISKEINVKAGDKIYFLLTKNGGNAGTYGNGQDVVVFNTSVMYTKLESITTEDHTVGTEGLVLAGATYQSQNAIYEEPKNGFSFVRIDHNTNTVHPMVYDNGYMRVTNVKQSVDYYGYFGNNYSGSAAASCDIAVVYTAPIKINIDITADGKFGGGQSGGNGVNLYVCKNNFNFKIGEHYYAPAATNDTTYKYTVKNITLDAGDKIYVALNSNGGNGFDNGSFSAKIKCNAVNPGEDATQPESQSHAGQIEGNKIYLTPISAGDLIQSFTDESFVNVKSNEGYLTKYAAVKTGDIVVIDGEEHVAIISGDGNGNGKVDRNIEGGDLERIREKLVGYELSELEQLAYRDDTDSRALVRRMKEVASLSDLRFAPRILDESEVFELDSEKVSTEVVTLNRVASEFGVARITINNNSDTNYGELYYKTTTSDEYNMVPFYFGQGSEVVSLPLETTTLYTGTIEAMYLSFPNITEGSLSAQLKTSSESKYKPMNEYEGDRYVLITDSISKTAKVVDLSKLQLETANTLNEENTIWTSGTIDLGIDDAKLRYSSFYGKEVVILTSSSGYVAIVDYKECKTLWSTSLGNQVLPHAIEMLPNGDIVIACSGNDSADGTDVNGKLLYYQVKSTGWSNTSTVSLKSAHGVEWDDTNDLLWALGMDGLFAYQVTNEGVLEQVEGKGFELPACGGHALSRDYENTDYLWITTAIDKVMKFDVAKNQLLPTYNYADMAIDSDGRVFAHAVHIKGITSFEDGTIVFCKADEKADTSNILYWIDSMGTKKYVLDNVSIYKVNKLDVAY